MQSIIQILYSILHSFPLSTSYLEEFNFKLKVSQTRPGKPQLRRIQPAVVIFIMIYLLQYIYSGIPRTKRIPLSCTHLKILSFSLGFCCYCCWSAPSSASWNAQLFRKMWFRFSWENPNPASSSCPGRKIPQSCYQHESTSFTLYFWFERDILSWNKTKPRVRLYVLIFHNLVKVNLHSNRRLVQFRQATDDDRYKNCGSTILAEVVGNCFSRVALYRWRSFFELKPQEGGRGKGIFSFPVGEEKCDFAVFVFGAGEEVRFISEFNVCGRVDWEWNHQFLKNKLYNLKSLLK